MRRLALTVLLAFCLHSALCQQVAPAASSQPESGNRAALFAQVKAATVVILAGEGAGRLHSIATGVLIRPDGVILTANHAIKGASEVQVRLAGGDVFDRVDLLGVDERRDVAALKITAGGLPYLLPGKPDAAPVGESVFAVTNAQGLTYSATEGILSAIRPADEISGAGSGYRLLQFTAPIAPGSIGGVCGKLSSGKSYKSF